MSLKTGTVPLSLTVTVISQAIIIMHSAFLNYLHYVQDLLLR
jgi:hypothetical protein